MSDEKRGGVSLGGMTEPKQSTSNYLQMLPPRLSKQSHRSVELRTNIGLAVEALWANRLRSLLTSLGIFIGVAAVVAALLLTQGVSASVTGSVSSLGSNTLTILPGAATSTPGGPSSAGDSGTTLSLTPEDAEAVSKVPGVAAASPVLSDVVQVVFENQSLSTQVQGVEPSYQTIQGWNLAEGDWFSTNDSQSGRSVALLGQTPYHKLFDASGLDPIGRSIRIRDQDYRVVGVLASKGGFGSPDNTVMVPFLSAQARLKPSNYVDQIEVKVDSNSDPIRVQAAITTLLTQLHHIRAGTPDDFHITNSTQLLQTLQSLTTSLTLLLVGVAAISLMVGGIGIMNIMIVSVTERTREIGLRMSLGARQGDIRNQFLVEALTLCLIGGIIGLLIGLLIGLAITKATGLPLIITPVTILMPFLVSLFVGVTFGLYPASRASRLDPIEALRAL